MIGGRVGAEAGERRRRVRGGRVGGVSEERQVVTHSSIVRGTTTWSLVASAYEADTCFLERRVTGAGAGA